MVMSDRDIETLRERDARLNAWLAGVNSGDTVTVRLNSTDTLTGKVYEAPDDSGRTALYVYTTLLRYGNGYPGPSFEPVSDRVVGGESLADEVARVLGEHARYGSEVNAERSNDLSTYWQYRCQCGDLLPPGGFADVRHHAHVAAALLPLFERVQAEAWDQGWAAGARDAQRPMVAWAPNPYLRDRAGEGS